MKTSIFQQKKNCLQIDKYQFKPPNTISGHSDNLVQLSLMVEKKKAKNRTAKFDRRVNLFFAEFYCGSELAINNNV